MDMGGSRRRSTKITAAEPPRRGESVEECWTCREADEAFVWTEERWRVSMPATPASVPTVVLHTRAHLDFHDLTDEYGAELGVLLVGVQRAWAG